VIATEPRSTAAFELVPCPVCRATEASPFLAGCRERLLDLPDEFSLVRCDACGLVRLNPRPTPDAIGAYYPAEYLPFGAEMLPPSGGLKRLLQSTLRRVYEWRQGGPPYQLVGAPGRRVLDVGCGTGWFLDRFTTTGWEAWGVELNAAAAAKARGRPGVRCVIEQAIEEAALPEEFFDVVTFRDSIEHAFDPRLALEKSWRALKPGGVVELLTPDISSFEARLFKRDWYALELPRHLQLFSQQTLGRLLETTGFEIVKARPTAVPRGIYASLDYYAETHFGRRLNTRAWQHMWVHHALLPIALGLALAGTGMSIEMWGRKP